MLLFCLARADPASADGEGLRAFAFNFSCRRRGPGSMQRALDAVERAVRVATVAKGTACWLQFEIGAAENDHLKTDGQSIMAMRTWQALPDAVLASGTSVTAAFSRVGARTYRDAAFFVYRLPYGRTSSRTDLLAVLGEGHGTCSSKHALLAELAIEQRLPVKLMLGIYLMDERNTPGVGAVLGRYGLGEIPEAHCYLAYDGARIDVTRAVDTATEPIAFLHEEQISPAQIGAYKVRLHQSFLRNWLREEPIIGTWTFEKLWEVREECIAALAS